MWQTEVRGRLPPAGGADRPASVADRAGTLARQAAGMGVRRFSQRLALRSIRSLPCAVRRIGQAAVGFRAGRTPKGAFGLRPGAIRGVCRDAAGGRAEECRASHRARLPRGSRASRSELGIRQSPRRRVGPEVPPLFRTGAGGSERRQERSLGDALRRIFGSLAPDASLIISTSLRKQLHFGE